MEKISCLKCGHSWDMVSDDAHPHLCHKCGYDNNLGEYNKKEFIYFWMNNQDNDKD